jgi:hypothetical protein
MITKASKCPPEVIQRVADFIYNNKEFCQENFPLCNSATDLTKTLSSSQSWEVLTTKRDIVIFKLETSELSGKISQICNESDPESLAAALKEGLSEIKTPHVIVRATPNQAKPLESAGFSPRKSYVKFSRVPSRVDMMPMLPLMNPTSKQIAMLAQLMYESYAKTDSAFQDTQLAANALRDIISGKQGQYRSDASFASGALSNLVSTCLITTAASGGAEIAQLFTHPLYRARGLATTEITMAMNQLARSNVTSLAIWTRASDDLLRRLLTKLDFGAGERAVEMELEKENIRQAG